MVTTQGKMGFKKRQDFLSFASTMTFPTGFIITVDIKGGI